MPVRRSVAAASRSRPMERASLRATFRLRCAERVGPEALSKEWAWFWGGAGWGVGGLRCVRAVEGLGGLGGGEKQAAWWGVWGGLGWGGQQAAEQYSCSARHGGWGGIGSGDLGIGDLGGGGENIHTAGLVSKQEIPKMSDFHLFFSEQVCNSQEPRWQHIWVTATARVVTMISKLNGPGWTGSGRGAGGGWEEWEPFA